jgi:cytochrome c-type biogenesis protein CcmH
MKKFKLFIILVSFFLIFENNLNAQNSNQVNKISKNLRCLICQGQSVYDSQSDFAISMRILIQKKIDEGKNENEIYEFLKNKYGEWIIYDPEINKNTFLLWLIPLILFVSGGLLIIRKVSIK